MKEKLIIYGKKQARHVLDYFVAIKVMLCVYAILAFAGVSHAQSQQGFIYGKVVDDKNEPLIGVSVVVKGTSVGGVTDAKGVFLIKADETSTTELVLSYLGMKTLTVPLKNQPAKGQWVITMQEDHLFLDELVVTGYQTVKKHELTGAVKKLSADDIMQNSKFSIDQMLAGQIAGMSVIQMNGEPSATPRIRIRGTSSILGNKAPIWVLDGVVMEDINPVSNMDLDADDAVYLIGSSIAGLNPQDIEDIVVLKDAAATSLYGTRAANGVIVITTKKGKAGAPQVRYSGNVSVSTRETYSQRYLMNASERIQLSQDMIDAQIPYSRFPSSGVGYEGLLLAYQNKEYSYSEFLTKLDEMVERNTDWFDILFRNPVSHNHSVSLGGGDDKTRYYASLGYNNSQGTAINSSSERYSAMANIDSWLSHKLHISSSVAASQNKNHGFLGSTNVSEWARTTSRTIPVYNSDGSLFYYPTAHSGTSGGTGGISVDPAKEPLTLNYLNELNETGALASTSSTDIKLNLQWDFHKNFRYEFVGSVNEGRSVSQSWATDHSFEAAKIRGYNYGAREPLSADEQESKLPYGGTFSSSETRKTTYDIQNKLFYNKSINKHHLINAMVVSEVKSSAYKGYSSSAWGWRGDRGSIISPQYNAANYDAIIRAMLPKITDYTVNSVSYLGSASYSYDDKLFLDGKIRMEGSNQFGDNPKYRFKPIWSVSGKYILSREEFLKNSPAISYLAFRGSFGLQGNVPRNTSPFLVAQLYNYLGSLHFDASLISIMPNPDLRWEKTKSYNLAMDFGLFDGLISGAVDVYRKFASDLILNLDISQINGVSTLQMNGGNMENKGIDIDLKTYPIRTKDWELGIGLIFGYNKNVITKTTTEVRADVADWQKRNANWVNGNVTPEGYPYGGLWSYRFAGLDNETGLPVFYEGGETGAYMKPQSAGSSSYVITTADDPAAVWIPNRQVYNKYVDIVYSGSPNPTTTGGFNLNLRYKRLSLNAGFTYALGGVKRLPTLYTEYNKVYDPIYNVSKELADRWRQPGDEKNTDIPALYNSILWQSLPKKTASSIPGSVLTTSQGTFLYDKSDARIASTDNFRLNSLSLRYRLEDKVLKHLGVSDLQLSLQATNLFVVADKAWHGRDPEQGTNANVRLPRTYTMGVNIAF